MSISSPRILVVGGGSGGLTTASMLLRRQPSLQITIVEPNDFHYYQPAWTLVGGGCYAVENTRQLMSQVIPAGAKWIQQKATGFAPDQQQVELDDGRTLDYDILIVAMGIQIDWHSIAGLSDTLGRNGVCSNYRYDTAPYTWECIQKHGDGPALFTQPVMPIKCAGAPQKIMYLAADAWRTRGNTPAISFHTPGGAMFGVPFYAEALDKVVDSYQITPQFGEELIAVDGDRRQALFRQGGDTPQEIRRDFEMLHVTPPQSAPDLIKNSPLAAESGWMSVDKHSLQHTQYPNIFGLGDCTTTPNSKTAAAVRNQAPVVAQNVVSTLAGSPLTANYDGYASCPLTTSRGKIILAEFGYDGVVMPSFALDPRIPRRSYWWLKESFLPRLYWHFMLKGRPGPDWHRERTYSQAMPQITP